MKRFGHISKIKSKIVRSKYILYGAVIAFSSLAPLVVSASTATASATFSNYPTTSTYSPGQVTTDNGSLWYIEGTYSAPNSHIANMTTSGTVTDYAISVGTTSLDLSSLTTGPDGNIWFDGCSSSTGTGAIYTGFLNVSTGAVTTYENTTSGISCDGGDLPGGITTGSDGYIWYTASSYNYAGDNGYLFSVNPSTGATVHSYNEGVNYIPSSLTTGPDGRLWFTFSVQNNEIVADSVSGGAVTGGNAYHAGVWNSGPTDITSGPDGNLWVVEQVSPRKIAKVTTGGSVTEYTLASGVYPGPLAAGSDGAMWFDDNGSTPKVGRISSSGSVTEYTIPGGASANTVNGLTLGPDNAMWFTYRDSGGPEMGRLGY